LEATLKDATHWSTRSLAAQVGLSPDRRVQDRADVRVATTSAGGLETVEDPQFIDKVREVVGLDLDPPERAVVLCVDGKSQIQALDGQPTPLIWTKTADQILESIACYCKRTNDPGH
jgi:hypothetical protein